MKNASGNKYLLLLFSLFVIQSSSIAARDCCVPDNCCDQYYDCGNPLNCGSVDFQIQAGVAPVLWRDRGEFSAVTCNGLAIPGFNQTIVNFFKLPKFSTLFHVPWIVGGHIGYGLTDYAEVYVEFNYRSAKAKTFSLLNVTIPNDVVNITLSSNDHYRVFDAYLGARYYWGFDCCCTNMAFFFGGKFGLVHHKGVNAAFNVTSVVCPVEAALNLTSFPLFFRNTAPAAGLNLGFEWCVGCNFSVVLTGEVVATCGPKSNNNVPNINSGCNILPTIFPTNLIVGHIGTELFFPVTLGLKYSF